MSFWIAGAIVVSTTAVHLQTQKAQKKAQKKAEEDALENEKQARKAEVFGETEGLGVGSLGKISLEVDDEEEDKRVGKVRI